MSVLEVGDVLMVGPELDDAIHRLLYPEEGLLPREATVGLAPRYSTNEWESVELRDEMRKRGYHSQLAGYPPGEGGPYCCWFSKEDRLYGGSPGEECFAVAMAAKKALEDEARRSEM